MHHVSLLSVRFVGRANGPGIRVIRVHRAAVFVFRGFVLVLLRQAIFHGGCASGDWDAAPPTPTGSAQIVSDYFLILHPVPGNCTHDFVGRFGLRIRVRARQATLDLHAQ